VNVERLARFLTSSNVLVLQNRKQYFLEVEGFGKVVCSQWTQLSLYLPPLFCVRMDKELHYKLALLGPGAETQYFSIK
jgi:hypothetical protein